MGFSLYFMRMKNDQQLDVDRDAIVSFLGQRGLQVSPLSGHLVDGAGQALKFDGGYTDLTLDQLDQGEPLTGCIHHATLSAAECTFIYDLCAAANFLIVNPQGDPSYLVPRRWRGPCRVVSTLFAGLWSGCGPSAGLVRQPSCSARG